MGRIWIEWQRAMLSFVAVVLLGIEGIALLLGVGSACLFGVIIGLCRHFCNVVLEDLSDL